VATFRSYTNTFLTTPGTTHTGTKPAGAIATDGLIAIFATASGGSPTHTPPAGWTLIATSEDGGERMSIYFRVVQPGDPASWDWTSSASKPSTLALLCYQGTDETTPWDVQASATSTFICPTVTTTMEHTNLLRIHWRATEDTLPAPTTDAQPAGYTERIAEANTPTTKMRIVVGEKTHNAIGATGTATFNLTGVGDWAWTLALTPRPRRWRSGGAIAAT
jgi:hypothetical protein